MGTFLILSALIVIIGAVIIVSILISTNKKTVTKSPKPTTPETSKKKSKKIDWHIPWKVIVFLIVSFLVVKHYLPKEDAKKKIIPSYIKKIAEDNVKTKIIYRFSDYPNGEITKFINKNVIFTPLGGNVKVITSSRRTYVSVPGNPILREPEDSGPFTFSRADKNAWGIEIQQ